MYMKKKGEMNKMIKSLDVKGKTISQIARWYFNDQLYVNRCYQRKLVWSLDEKKLFINSLICGFPTPSVILNKAEGEGADYYEIIDGLQRLDAIVSFLSGNFPVKYKEKDMYFDKSAIPAVHKEKKSIEETGQLLPIDECLDFADVEIPIVICNQDEKNITEIFCRINSYGKKLSLQDLRQASIISEFSELVRRCSTHVRGDYTYSDLLNLCDMRKISLSGEGLNYGINHEKVFWRYHGIITYDNLRKSRDEEIVATILANYLLGRTGYIGRYGLDKLYNLESKECIEVNKKIQSIGIENIEDDFISARRWFDNIFSSVNSTFSDYLFTGKKIPGKDNIFMIVFLALLNLRCENYEMVNYSKIANTIKNSVNTIFNKVISGNHVSSEEVSNMYISFFSTIKNEMRQTINRQKTDIEKEINKRLSISDIELAMTEFKIGIIDLDTKKVNDSCIAKIAKTLVAMANTPNDEAGYVIVGIADEKDSSDRWERIYGSQPLLYGNHFVVGIEDEARRTYVSLDHYIQTIKDKMKSEDISEPLKQFVLSNMKVVNFEQKKLLVLESKKMQGDSKYKGIKYIRNGNSTEKV